MYKDTNDTLFHNEDALGHFVDVIVPVHVPGKFTYRVPRKFENQVKQGTRVLVEFGRRKVYAALIVNLHNQAPKTHTAKYILDILDTEEIILPTQLQLWEWMSDYYMAHLGSIMSAGLPAGLRLHSETMVRAYGQSQDLDLSTEEHILISLLEQKNESSLSEISQALGNPSKAHRVINRLIGLKAISLHEKVTERFKPKYETYLLLNPEYEAEVAMQHLFSQLERRAHAQTAIMLRYVELSKYGSTEPTPVLKKKLLEHSGASASALKSLLEKEVLYEIKEEVGRIKDHEISAQAHLELNPRQTEALQKIRAGFQKGNKCLLHGVTSSGKTEVYIELIKTYVEAGEQVLFMVPEIALTTQLIKRLQIHFGKQIVVYHSHYSQAERYEIWQNLMNPGVHDHRIVLGARSSIFLPFRNLGLIVVDEEHDSSYKQFDPSPRYQARDVAFVLGRLHKARVLMGSATPSVESMQLCRTGKMHLVEMKKRYGGVQLPEILVSDISKEYRKKTMTSHFSSLLMNHMQEALEGGKQVILFQNRRGYNPLWQCEGCGWTPECNRCDVSMTYHKAIHLLKCHYCGKNHSPPHHCPACGSKALKMIGFGTEKIEEELQKILPEYKIDRMDMDTTRGKNAHAKILQRFEQREIDVLIGTQMVTKGLDFAHVHLVGILNADLMINRSDFRAFERAYQMMTQVAGRAGRKAGGQRGKVVIQTMQPEHWVVRNVVDHSYHRLLEQEILERRNFKYPPFVRMLVLTISHKKRELVEHASHELAKRLKSFLGERILGPQFPYIARIKDRYRMEIIIKIERKANSGQVKQRIQDSIDHMSAEKTFRPVRISIDVDPQ